MIGRKTVKDYQWRITLLLVVDFIVIIVFLLHISGLINIDDLLRALHLADKPAYNAATEVHFIDVGQGDATLVISDGHAMLIDSGDVDKYNDVQWYLRNHGVRKLDYLIATHPHSDHIGEMSEIIDSFEIGTFIMPDFPDELTPTSYVFEQLLLSLKQKDLKITSAADTSFKLGTCEVTTFTPKGEYDDLNNYSVVVKIVDGDNSFLVTGDCETAEEEDLISQGFDLSAKVLKAGHHGSSGSTGYDFLNKVLPRYCVISCSLDNTFGHPSGETLRRVRKYTEKIYVTSVCGDIVFYSDGEGLDMTTEKEADAIETIKPK